MELGLIPNSDFAGILERNKKEEILVSVRDSGIGIEEKDKDKVFKEFEQIESGLSRKYAGTGLGMPLAKKLVELHGGKIWFESEGKDKGCRFSFMTQKRFLMPYKRPWKRGHTYLIDCIKR